MWYSINFFTLSLQLLPTMLRKPAVAAFSQAILKPVDSLYYSWGQLRERNVYKLTHTGQVCRLRKALNDSYDPDQRRIYIGEGNIYDTQYIYTEAEAQEAFTGTEAEAGIKWLRNEAETADTGLDFIVWVPASIYSTQIHGLRATVELYRAGGKRYDIYIIQ